MAAVAVGAAGSLAGETLPRVCRSHRRQRGQLALAPASRRCPAAAGGGRSRGGGGAGIPARSPPRTPLGQASAEPAPLGGCNPAAGFGDWPIRAAAPR